MCIRSPIFGLLLALCSIYTAYAASNYPIEFTKQVQDYPDIMGETRSKCLPIKGTYYSADTYVCDPDQLLTVEEINSLNSRIYDIRNNINKDSIGLCDQNKPRPSIAIALVRDMKIGEMKTEEVLNYASVFSYYLFDEWKLSTACSSGTDKIIIFYSAKDNVLYTYAGINLNQKLPSKTIIRVSVASKPSFSLNIASGLKYLLERYKSIMTGRDSRSFNI